MNSGGPLDSFQYLLSLASWAWLRKECIDTHMDSEMLVKSYY